MAVDAVMSVRNESDGKVSYSVNAINILKAHGKSAIEVRWPCALAPLLCCLNLSLSPCCSRASRSRWCTVRRCVFVSLTLPPPSPRRCTRASHFFPAADACRRASSCEASR
jgi:hypothetical protein